MRRIAFLVFVLPLLAVAVAGCDNFPEVGLDQLSGTYSPEVSGDVEVAVSVDGEPAVLRVHLDLAGGTGRVCLNAEDFEVCRTGPLSWTTVSEPLPGAPAASEPEPTPEPGSGEGTAQGASEDAP